MTFSEVLKYLTTLNFTLVTTSVRLPFVQDLLPGP